MASIHSHAPMLNTASSTPRSRSPSSLRQDAWQVFRIPLLGTRGPSSSPGMVALSESSLAALALPTRLTKHISPLTATGRSSSRSRPSTLAAFSTRLFSRYVVNSMHSGLFPLHTSNERRKRQFLVIWWFPSLASSSWSDRTSRDPATLSWLFLGLINMIQPDGRTGA
jgi:hypothetical protein